MRIEENNCMVFIGDVVVRRYVLNVLYVGLVFIIINF